MMDELGVVITITGDWTEATATCTCGWTETFVDELSIDGDAGLAADWEAQTHFAAHVHAAENAAP